MKRKGNNKLTINLPIPILIRQLDHLIHIRIRHILAQALEDSPQLFRRDGTRAILIKHLERLQQLFFGIGLLDRLRHQAQKLLKVDDSVLVHVRLVDQVLQLRLGRVKTELAHDYAQFFGGDVACVVLIEEVEDFAELGDLVGGEGGVFGGLCFVMGG